MIISPRFTALLTVTRYPLGANVVLSGPPVAGNVIALTVGATPLSVTYATSAALTMAALAAAIAGAPGVTAAIVNADNPNRIDVTPAGLAITGVGVTGGVSQPTIALSGGAFGGSYVAGLSTTLTQQASVQPIQGRELLNFPEGEREKEMLKIYSTGSFQTADKASGAVADTIAWNGKNYKVTQVLPYTLPITGAYYKAVATLVDDSPGT
jgi:hypothetical protein